ncbi:MAG: 4Fe-4S dicluster domain-containing protein [Desulfobacterales bacterium]
MSLTAEITVQDGDLLATLREFLRSILIQDDIDALLVPQHLPGQAMVMPVLVSDPEQLGACDPLAPAFPLNSAKLVSRLTRKPAGAKIAALLRPCEMRAFIELVKLKQGSRADLLLIGMDCLGAVENRAYTSFAGDDPTAATLRFAAGMLAGEESGVDLAAACKVCEHPFPEAADVALGLWGVDTARTILAEGCMAAGETLLRTLDLPETEVPAARQTAREALTRRRTAARDEMFAATQEATQSLEKLSAYLAGCVNCYNCRVACPVCYCRECVFVTDVFDHEPIQYLHWAARKGRIKMPTDTVFYHLTRLAHMSTACVGCGQCSNACPNDIPVMELFRTVAQRTPQAFDYRAGRSIDDPPPLTEFKENEFQDVVGL